MEFDDTDCLCAPRGYGAAWKFAIRLYQYRRWRIYAKALPAVKAFRAVAIFLRELTRNAEQLTNLQRWRRILSRAFQVFLQGRQLRSPPRLAPG
jgi:hypothetical protein